MTGRWLLRSLHLSPLCRGQCIIKITVCEKRLKLRKKGLGRWTKGILIGSMLIIDQCPYICVLRTSLHDEAETIDFAYDMLNENKRGLISLLSLCFMLRMKTCWICAGFW